MATLKELRQERIKKLEKLKDMGFNPYPPHAQKDIANAKIVKDFEKLEGDILNVTGRILSKRTHSQLCFMDLHDFSGKIQLYIKEDELPKTNPQNQEIGFSDLDLLDIGDFVQAEGEVTKTKTGEVSILVKRLMLLTKSIRPLPDKHEGLKDTDTIYRRRYLDLAINPDRREFFVRKSKFWETCRNFLKSKGFIEVETPILEHITGGADAKPFITHHDSLDQQFYLRISTELYLKRLIGGGFEKIYTFGPNFRNEGLSDEHLQEFMDIEWYWAYADYRDNMKLVEELFKHAAKEVYGKTKFTKDNYEFDLGGKWEVIKYDEIIKDKFGIDVFDSSDKEILEVLKKHKVQLPGTINRNRLIDNLWKLIRKDVSGPAFLINQPKFISPLAKSLPENEDLTERFQVIIAGSELGNGYTELNDPFDQLERFKDQQKAREAGDEEAQMLDIDYVEMLEYGMPPTSGYGQSERVFWFLENVTAREGVFFPQMRYKVDEITKEIYQDIDFEDDKPAPEFESSTKVPDKIDFNPSQAKKLLDEMVNDDYQKLHALMVGEALKHYAKEFGEDENLWYMTGLLHDLDYFNHPDDHPKHELEWFKKWDFPQDMIHAISAHAFKRTGEEPKTILAAALLATDELSGLLYAYSLMRPEGFSGMKVKSAKKKFKDKSFAKKVDREEIKYGVEKFKKELSEHVEFLIKVFNEMDELKT